MQIYCRTYKKTIVWCPLGTLEISVNSWLLILGHLGVAGGVGGGESNGDALAG